MPTLNEKLELGAALFTQPRDLGERRVYGTATTASSDGSVSVDVGGETVTIPTVGAVAQGDEVVIQVQNGHPVAIGVRGWGDEIQADVNEVTSHVWIDDNGNLRVTREPEDQNPTDGVTITNQAVDVASTDYTSELSDNGLTILKNDSIGQVMRMTSTLDGANSLPSVMGRRGLILLATSRTNLDNIGAAYDAIVIQPSPPSTGAYKDVVASIEYLGVPVFQAKTDRIQFGGVQYGDVYPVATASHLGPVKVGDGLSVSGAGLLSANVGAWRSVSVVSSYLPSAFNIRDVRVYANDQLRLLYFYVHFENSSGTNVNAGSNAVFFSCTDTSLYPSATKEVCDGLRYSSSGLLDFPVNMYQWNQSLRTWGFRGPSWAFSASSIKFSGVIPYDSAGIA